MQDEINSLLRQAQGRHASGQLVEAQADYAFVLARDPDNVLAHLRLSELLQASGRFRAARTSALAAESAIRKTRRWDGLPFVTMQLLGFEERELVKRAILAADWSQPEILRHSPVLSQHLWLCDAFDDALRLIEQASARVAPSPLLSYSRASALRFAGRRDEATAELEHCLALAPTHPQAHWTLAYHQKSDPPGARVDRIRRAQAALPALDPGQVFLDYALFKELDDADDVAGAWQCLQRGMRAKRAEIRYDPAAQSAAIDEIIRRVARGVGAEPGAPAGEHRPLFVVGLPRTGTTLLEQILANHRDVASAGELGDLTQAIDWEVDAFVGSPPSPASQAMLDGVDPGALGARYLARTAVAAGTKAIFVDKNPSNLYHVAAITRALPSARILCLVRDPMDACFSNLKELFPGQGNGYSYDFAEMAAQHRSFTRLVAAFERQFPMQFLPVRYEELVADPERVAARIADACGLAPQAGLADLEANTRPVTTASTSQVRGKVHGGNIGAWRRYAQPLEPLRAMLEE